MWRVSTLQGVGTLGCDAMAKVVSGADSKQAEAVLVDEADSGDFEAEETPAPARQANSRDPAIRRKIEDRLERIRLREELGIYDDKDLADL